MKSLEQQLLEKENEIRDLRKTAGKAALVQQLSESGLPAAAQARLRKRLESAQNLDGLGAAITDEREYIRQVRKANARSQDGRSTETQESDAGKRSLFDGYRAAFGLSEKEARLAAGIENAVDEINESQQKLYDAAKAMGLSDAEAKAVSEPKQSSSW
jgi:hypothetical protein